MKISFNKVFLVIFVTIVALLCIFPMGLDPIWNGEIPDHRNQYELMAESILHGHLYLDIEVEDELKNMDNPYDFYLREQENIPCHWDHAYYKGHYYMYFGVAPVLFLFLPYRIITGHALTTYHGSQILTVLIIIGFFALFSYLQKKFFKSLNYYNYMLAAGAFSVMSIWYVIEAPALYCTAIVGGISSMIWGIYFVLRAVYDDISFNRRIKLGIVGAFFGALTFASRPSIGMVSLVFIPLFIVFLKRNTPEKKDIWKVFMIFVPYIVVAALLMTYNYLRFDNPFEFGQAYQITASDQHNYSLANNFNLSNIILGIKQMLFINNGYERQFPWITFGGILAEFPILIASVLIFIPKVRRLLQEKRFFGIALGFIVSALAVIVMDTMYSPWILERYHTDIYFIFAILTFIAIGFTGEILTGKAKKVYTLVFDLLYVDVAIRSVLLFLVPYDANLTSMKPQILEMLRQIF